MHFDLSASGRRRRSVAATMLVLISAAVGSAMALLVIVPHS
ncbi:MULTISPECIES: hypothetical protein [Hyphomicrobiales]|jgi:hypothetical protein|uniref:Uncharacterized protein n=1 Tax=Bosea massiliensis TaxID=151419 RepID=A0ABW0NWA1_9HYPH|nr:MULTISPECIES: hypothetical protein [Hyphomicrobiales]